MSINASVPGPVRAGSGDVTSNSNHQEGTESPMMLPTIPTSAEVLANVGPDSGAVTTALDTVHGNLIDHVSVRARLSRYDCRDEDGSLPPAEWTVDFTQASDGDHPGIHPSEIPALIDTLTEMHRAWRHLDPECAA